jgi:hypothetical protein
MHAYLRGTGSIELLQPTPLLSRQWPVDNDTRNDVKERAGEEDCNGIAPFLYCVGGDDHVIEQRILDHEIVRNRLGIADYIPDRPDRLAVL